MVGEGRGAAKVGYPFFYLFFLGVGGFVGGEWQPMKPDPGPGG